MRHLRSFGQFIRYQSTVTPEITTRVLRKVRPVDKPYTYTTDLPLVQSKIVDQIEKNFPFVKELKHIELDDITIVPNNHSESLNYEESYKLKSDVTNEDTDEILKDLKKVIHFKTQDSKDLKCSDCNIALQMKDPKEPGYLQLPKIKSHAKKHDLYSDGKNALMNEFKQMAGLDENYKSPVLNHDEFKQDLEFTKVKDLLKMKFQCDRCKFINSQMNKHKVEEVDIRESSDIMNQIPKYKTIVYVCSALDFPLGIDKSLVKGRSNVIYVINKVDIFYSNPNQSTRLGTKYFQGLLDEYLGKKNNQMVLISASKQWNLDSLLALIKDDKDVYFVGRANTGKSNLIKSLMKKVHGKKYEGKLPGVGALPGYTRFNNQYRLSSQLIINDTPGFAENGGVSKYILPEYRMENTYPMINPTESKYMYGFIQSKFKKVFNGNNLLTYGGLFYLVPPKGAVIKVKYMFNKRSPKFEAKYKTWNRLEEVNSERPEAINLRFLVTKRAIESMVLYEIPKFHGSVDIIIRDFGTLSFQPTSSPDINEPFKIWLPKDVVALSRPAIFKYIYKNKEKKLADLEENHLKPLKLVGENKESQ